MAPLTKPTVIILLTLIAVALIAVWKLFETFAGDQAMFVVYAAEINRGALLYRDIWDLKQPGIFLFYLAGGKLFGFTEFGIHLFELLYWLTFSVILSVTLKRYFSNAVFASLTPLLTVGVYYAVCGSWHLTQVEGLVGFPLYLTLWTAVESLRTQAKMTRFALLCLSGFAGAVVLVFKLLFLPIIVLFWLTILISFIARHRDTAWLKVLFRTADPILFGAAIPLGAVVLYFAWHDALSIVNYTYFEYPAQAVTAFAGENRLPILKQGLHWFMTTFSSLIILIFVWGLVVLKGTKAQNKRFVSELFLKLRQADLLTVNLFLWVFAGLGIILVQRLSWWEYHYLLLLVPLGILAMKGIEAIWEQTIRISPFFAKPLGQTVFIICLLILFTPILRLPVQKFKRDYLDRIGSTTKQLWAPHGDMDEQYRQIQGEVAFLSEPNSRPGKIFVCAQPLYYYLSKRSPALATNGWMPEFFLPEQWNQLNEELTAKPLPAYIVIENYCGDLINRKSPETAEILEEKYHLRSANNNIAWYELADAP